MAIPGKLEAAFGATRSADPAGMTFTDLTADTAQNAVTITRGNRAGALEAAAGNMGVLMNNPVGNYTPYRAASIYHPNMRKGLIVRHSLNTGARYLALTGLAGCKVTAPDAASFDIVGNLAGAIQLRSPVRIPASGFNLEVVGKYGAAGQRSWRLLFGGDGRAFFSWSADGTNILTGSTAIGLPRPDAGPLTFGWELVVATGVVTWYLLKGTIATLLASPSSYLFDTPTTPAGATSIFSSTADVEIGDFAASSFLPYPGGVEGFFLRAGSLTAGTIAAQADWTTAAVGAGSIVDTAATPKTWTNAGGASITDRKITFTGTLDGNEGSYPGQSVPGTAQRQWTINGPLRRLRQGEKPIQSALFRRIMAPVGDTTVRVYYPAEEPGGAETVYSPIAGIPPGVMSMNLGADDTLSSSQPLPNQAGGQPFGWSLSFPPVTSAAAWESGFFLQIPVAPAGGELFDYRIDTVSGTTTEWVFRFDATNYRLFAKDETGVNVLATTTVHDPRMFGLWVIVMISLAQNGADIDYGIRIIPVGGGVFATTGTLAGHTLGSPVGLRTLSAAATTPSGGVSIGHHTITEGAVAGWLAPADTAYVGEPALRRALRLCQEQGVPMLPDGVYAGTGATSWATPLGAGAKAMGPQRPLPLLDLLEECRQVEHGLLGESRELMGLTLRAGSTFQNQTARLALTSEVTELRPADDDRGLVNDATVSKDNGSSARYVDSVSVTADGLYEDAKTINPASDLDLPDHAAWWVHEALPGEERYDEIPVELAKNTAKIDDWYSVAHGDLMTASALPAAEAKSPLAQLVVGSTQTISPLLWTAKPATVPAVPWNVGVRDSATMGRRDTSGSTTGGALTTTAPSVTVVSPVTVWTTAGGDVPFDIDIDGEQITVTAVASATSPQTFTLTRSVNGVVKTHLSGATVKLWRPTVRAH